MSSESQQQMAKLLACCNQDFSWWHGGPPAMEQSQVIQEEYVTLLPFELDAFFFNDLPTPLHYIFGYLRPVRKLR